MKSDREVLSLGWSHFRKAFEEIGGVIIDRLEESRNSYKVLAILINLFDGVGEVSLTYNQKKFPGHSYVIHILRFPQSVVALNMSIFEGELLGKVLRIEEVDNPHLDQDHTFGERYKIWIGDNIVRFT
jgi:hypothetical protein